MFPWLASDESNILEWQTYKVPPEFIVTGTDVTKPAWTYTHDFVIISPMHSDVTVSFKLSFYPSIYKMIKI